MLESSLRSVAALLQALVLSVGSWGLQMCCNVGGVSFFFFCGGRKKQNKFPSNLHCPVKKLNPFFRFIIITIVSVWSLSFYTCCQRFAALRSGGFLAQKFNRRTALEPTTKLSYKALRPPLRQTAVSRSFFIFYAFQIDSNLFFLQFSVLRFG